MREIKYFTPTSLVSSQPVIAADSKHICELYCDDLDTVARERNEFVAFFESMSPMVDASDLSSFADHRQQTKI